MAGAQGPEWRAARCAPAGRRRSPLPGALKPAWPATRWAARRSRSSTTAGWLVRKDPNGAPQSHFLWDRDNLLAELTGTGTALVAEYSYYGPDQLHALFVGGTEYNAHADGLGNVIALTDGAQTVTRTYGYTAWGQSAGGSDLRPFTNADRARFKGALWLGPEVDLYYMRARWYEPQSGRFLSEDPVGLEGGLNAYVYTSDDPVNSSDPLGLDEEPLEPPSPCEGAVDVLACLTGGWGGGGGGTREPRGRYRGHRRHIANPGNEGSGCATATQPRYLHSGARHGHRSRRCQYFAVCAGASFLPNWDCATVGDVSIEQ